MAQQTQDYLDEAKTPSIKTLAQANADILTFAPNVGAMRRQIALWRDELNDAILAESDLGLVEKLREAQQRLDVMEDGITNIVQGKQALIEFGKLFNVTDAEIRQYIIDEALGYTT